MGMCLLCYEGVVAVSCCRKDMRCPTQCVDHLHYTLTPAGQPSEKSELLKQPTDGR